MKALFYFAAYMAWANCASAQDPAYPTAPPPVQNLNRAEYFIDTDPGFGNGVNIPVTAATNLANIPVTVNIAGLSHGPHRLWLRTRSADGRWSLSSYREFLVDFDPPYAVAPPLQNLSKAEYFIDTDPGFGNGINIPVTSATDLSNIPVTVNTAGLSQGPHRVWVRTRNAEGRWSLSGFREFLVDFDPAYPTLPAVQNITRAEYFIDTDPGFGQGTAIPVSPATDLPAVVAQINTSGLSIGVHRLYLRTRNTEGRWSLTAQGDFLVDENPAYPTAPAAPGNLVYAEYFFNTDPGFGNGTAVVLSPAVDLGNRTIAVNTSALPDGRHTFYLRTLDDWSLTGYQSFIKGSALPLRLLSFYAKNKEQAVELEWKTTDETGTSHFDVERSADGIRFDKLGTIQAQNRPGTQQYAFADTRPLNSKSFYRLKQVDKDGKAEYSPTVLVNRDRGLMFQVFPSPARELVTVVLAPESTVRELALLDAGARTLKVVPIQAGTGNVSLSLAGLKGGTYFVRLRNGENVSVRPFIKL